MIKNRANSQNSLSSLLQLQVRRNSLYSKFQINETYSSNKKISFSKIKKKPARNRESLKQNFLNLAEIDAQSLLKVPKKQNYSLKEMFYPLKNLKSSLYQFFQKNIETKINNNFQKTINFDRFCPNFKTNESIIENKTSEKIGQISKRLAFELKNSVQELEHQRVDKFLDSNFEKKQIRINYFNFLTNEDKISKKSKKDKDLLFKPINIKKKSHKLNFYEKIIIKPNQKAILYKNSNKIKKKLINLKLKVSELAFTTLKQGLSLKKILTEKESPQTPFHKKGSYYFFNKVKKGDFESVQNILKDNSDLIFEYDYFYRTGLHWAVLKGYLNLVLLLINGNFQINAKDLDDKTALFYALKINNIEIVRALLYYGASPWNINLDNFQKDNVSLSNIIKKARKIDITLCLLPKKKRFEKWKVLRNNYI